MSNQKPPRIVGFKLNVADVERSLDFYTRALGFELAERTGRRARLRLGKEAIELIERRDGQPYPQERAANDPWFQHFAIAVSNMDAGYRRLLAYGHEPISIGGPQQLPPSTGSVIAYKFRDPDGHPLELSYIPGSDWLKQPAGAHPFLGIDHTGIAVGNREQSLEFYSELGFRLESRGFNTGPEQDRLDGLKGVQLDIDIIRAGPGPHLELLHYRSPEPRPSQSFAQEDIPSTVVIMDGSPGLSRGSDPDGHLISEFF